MEAGIVKVTRRVVPKIVVTADGVAVVAVPPLCGVSVTVTLAGLIVPLGYPEPVTMMTLLPGAPLVGDVVVVRVT
jgi:hypothetical protein